MIDWLEANIWLAWLAWAVLTVIAWQWYEHRRRPGLDISEAERRWREGR